jgi:hypothetical protein
MDDPLLNISDLQEVLNILQVAIKRGAFEPTELAAVGTIYTIIKKFVDQHEISDETKKE